VVTAKRSCAAKNGQGEPCRQPPLRDGEHCFWHDPAHADEATEARRLGGLRRRREKAVEGAYDIEGLEDVPAIRRLIEVAALDALSLENSIARARTLISAALAAAKLLEVGELEERLKALETTVQPRVPAKTGRGR
jgi:hypothetical protein